MKCNKVIFTLHNNCKVILNALAIMLCITLFSHLSFAKEHLNVEGEWSFTASYASCDPDPNQSHCEFREMEGTFYIEDQSNLLFYGDAITIGNHPFNDGLFTGLLDNKGKIIINIRGMTTIEGTFKSNDTMEFNFQNLDIFGRFGSGRGIATKQ